MKKQYSKTKPSCKVTFSLPKDAVKNATKVVVIGEFNSWNKKQALSLTAKKDGSFATVIELPTGQSFEFRYLIDDARWENDWTADAYVPSPFPGIFNSVVSLEMQPLEEKKASAKKAAAKKTASKKAPAKKAPAKKAAVKKAADKLTMIEGIGPKIAGLLKEDGIDTFAKLSKASQKKLKAVLLAAGPRFKMHSPATWPEQAKLAAKGEWDALKKLQDELDGGKR
ncbi:MAG: carbohydrate-binding module family 20 domain-containing protein [Bacteroidota bacterium]